MTMIQKRPSWTDYFNEPSCGILRKNLSDDPASYFDLARKKLSGLEGVTEKMTWFGDGWHWTVGYYTPHREEPLVVIIPDPLDLQLAMPLDRQFIESIPAKDVKKSLREGLELAQAPFDTRWGVWSLDNPGILTDFMDLVERKLQHLMKIAG